ncbi:MAG TPA: M15 family peptidase [Candidatus Brocadiaceae bacterium]
MPVFSSKSKAALSTCHPDLQTIFNHVIRFYDCIVLEGFRNEEDQNKALASGHTKLQWPNGKHNTYPSMAVDAAPFPLDFSNEKQLRVFAGFVLGSSCVMKAHGFIQHDVRWGGAWDGLGRLNKPGMLNDLVHFELVP